MGAKRVMAHRATQAHGTSRGATKGDTMSAHVRLSMDHARHGHYSATVVQVAIVEKRHPSGIRGLRAELKERMPEIDWRDLSRTECLIVLGEWEVR
jgi:hypothetical protein